MGEFVTFVTRRWHRNSTTFRYVEIGSVDPSLGIQGVSVIQTNIAPSRATQIIKKGDLIIGTTRPYLKKFAIVSSEYDNCVCSSGFQVISSNGKSNLTYLLEFLRTEPAIKQFKYFMTGALYPAITINDLKKIRIPCPPVDVQNEIANHTLMMREQQRNKHEQSTTLVRQALLSFENQLFDKI